MCQHNNKWKEINWFRQHPNEVKLFVICSKHSQQHETNTQCPLNASLQVLFTIFNTLECIFRVFCCCFRFVSGWFWWSKICVYRMRHALTCTATDSNLLCIFGTNSPQLLALRAKVWKDENIQRKWKKTLTERAKKTFCDQRLGSGCKTYEIYYLELVTHNRTINRTRCLLFEYQFITKVVCCFARSS